MKKTNLLVLSAAAALLATSCSKDQVTQSNPGEGIRFSAFTGNATKAAETTTTTISNFKVLARYATTSSMNFDDTFSGSTTSGWTSESSATHYWPLDAAEEVTFYAYSPKDYSAGTPSEATTSSFAINTVTIPSHASKQTDLVIAKNRSAKVASVALNFQHVFSQVELKALCGDANMTVKVYGAKLFGLQGVSNLTWPANNTDSDIANIWTTSGDKVGYMVGGTSVNTSAVTLSSDAQSIMTVNVDESGTPDATDGNFMLIPQNMGAQWNPSTDANNNNKGGYIAVLCQIFDATGKQVYPTTEGLKGFAAVPFTLNLQKSRKYSVTLQFFKDGGGAGIIPPDPTDPSKPDPDPGIDGGGDPGTPILGPMSFTVSVADWTDGGNTNTPMQ